MADKGHLLASALLLLALTIFLSKAIFTGSALLPLDILYQFPPWRFHAPNGFQTPKNPLLVDQVMQFYPWNALIRWSLSEGALPLWNPYSFCGSPLLANGQSAPFYPLNFFHHLLSPRFSYLLVGAIKLLIAGLSTYLFLRRISASHLSALFGAFGFMFGGYLIVWLGFPVSNSAVFLPLLSFLLERICEHLTLRKVAAFSLVAGLQFLGGQPETSACIFFFLTVYLLFRLREQFKAGRAIKSLLAKFLAYAGGAIWGASLASVQMLPFLEYLRFSAAYEIRSQYNVRVYPWYEIIDFLVPNFFGNPVHNNYWGFDNIVSTACYVGVLPLTFAIFAVLRRAKLAPPFALTLLLSLGVIYRLPAMDLILSLPALKAMGTNKFLLPAVFSLCCLAAIGLDRFVADASKSKKAIVAVSAINIVFAAIVISLRSYFSGHIRALNLEGYELKNLLIFSSVSSAGLLLSFAFSYGRLSARAFSSLIISLTVLDLFAFGLDFNPTSDPANFSCKPASVEFLERDRSLFRVLGLDDVLPPNTSALYRLHDVRGYDAMTPKRFFAYFSSLDPNLPNFYKALDVDGIKAIRSTDSTTLFKLEIKKMVEKYGFEFEEYLKRAYFWNTNLSQIAKPMLLDLMNVKYVLTPPTGSGLIKGSYKLVYDGEIKIYENPSCLPRAFFVENFEVINDQKRVLDILRSDSFNPSEKAILSHPSGKQVDIPVRSSRAISNGSSVQVIDYKPHKVVLRAKTSNPGVLVLSDSFYPGWRVFVNGKEKNVLIADHLFRGVFLEGGDCEVEFVYDPVSFKMGALISAFSSAAALLMLFFDDASQKEPPRD